MSQSIRRLSFVLLLAFAFLSMGSGYWTVVRGPALSARDDNPRLVEAERRVRRGRILDRHGQILSYSRPSDEGQWMQRVYVYPEAAPAVGYYNLKHGVGGIEAVYDDLLRGIADRSQWDCFLDDLLHRTPPGRDVRLTLDAALQHEIDGLMDEQIGAAVLLEPFSGQILAMISHPIYDPNTLDKAWDDLEADPAAPLLNRVTQGFYQPGGALQLFVLAAAIEADLAALEAFVPEPNATVWIDGYPLECVYMPKGRTLAQAVAAACPAPMADLGERLGVTLLQDALHHWGLDVAPLLEVATRAGELDPQRAAIGQGNLTVSPLQMALALATLANEGTMPAPRLVLEAQTAGDEFVPSDIVGQESSIITPKLARDLRGVLNLSADGAAVGHASLAVASANKPPHTWYLGLAPAKAPRYVVVVLLEHGGSDALVLAEMIGQRALAAALAQNSPNSVGQPIPDAK